MLITGGSLVQEEVDSSSPCGNMNMTLNFNKRGPCPVVGRKFASFKTPVTKGLAVTFKSTLSHSKIKCGHDPGLDAPPDAAS